MGLVVEKRTSLLNKEDYTTLNHCIVFFNMQELRRICEGLRLPKAGIKILLINRIMTFLTTGKIVLEPEIPEVSCIQKGQKISLSVNTLMLYGAYKNDASTRAFFKNIVGGHFHFTAFGIDWLKERWLAGNPPTYGEFADFWREETAARKKNKAPLKKEWALLNFVSTYLKNFPTAQRDEVVIAWKQERSRQVACAMKILSPILSTQLR